MPHPTPKDTALVLANHTYQTTDGKTAHGLVRESSRFQITGVIDPDLAGQDAGQALDGIHRAIPIFRSIQDALAATGQPPRYCIIGLATPGGVLPNFLKDLLLEAIRNNMSLVNGLHTHLTEYPELVDAAKAKGVSLIDIRKPKPRPELHFWTGAITQVKPPRIAVLGMDCAIGKRTTTRMLLEACNAQGIRTQMIYTGQTGWLQGSEYGFIFDSTPNDFVCGELEHAIVSCFQDTKPDLLLLEGQSSLQNPSGPCGAEFLLAAQAKGVILQCAPGRKYFEGCEELGFPIPDVESEIALVRAYGAQVLGVSLNNHGMSPADLQTEQKEMRARLNLPVIRPIEEGVQELVPVIQAFLDKQAS